MTRSLSVKIGRSSEENGNRSGAKKSLPAPKRIDADSWIQGSRENQSLRKETPGKTRFKVCLNFLFTFKIARSGNNVGDKASLWTKFAKGHQDKQSLNPFSDTYDKVI